MPLEVNRRRHRERLDPKGAAVHIFHGFEPSEILLQRRMVDIGRVLFDNRHDRCGIDKTRDVVDVAMRVVTGDSVPQPQSLCCAEKIAKYVRVVIAIELYLDQPLNSQ